MGAPSLPCFNMDQTFFGFKPKHQIQLQEQLFELLWAGDGRWDWDTLYHLPVHLRKFWVSKINKMREQAAASEQEAAEKTKNKLDTLRTKRTKSPR